MATKHEQHTVHDPPMRRISREYDDTLRRLADVAWKQGIRLRQTGELEHGDTLVARYRSTSYSMPGRTYTVIVQRSGPDLHASCECIAWGMGLFCKHVARAMERCGMGPFAVPGMASRRLWLTCPYCRGPVYGSLHERNRSNEVRRVCLSCRANWWEREFDAAWRNHQAIERAS